MGILTRAARNISRRKARALLLIVVLSLALALITSIPPNIIANQQGNQKVIDEIMGTVQANNEALNISATQMDCTLGLQFIYNQGPYKNETIMDTPHLNITDFSNMTSIPGVTDVIPVTDYWQSDLNGNPINVTYNGATYDTLFIWGVPLDASYIDKFPSILETDTWTFSTTENITAGRNLEAGDHGVVVLTEVEAYYLNA